MRRTARDSLGPLGVIALIAGLSASAPALGEEVEVCRLVSSQGASFLEHCGDRLLSFTLVLDDYRRSVGHDGIYGRFGFDCPIDLMCVGEPEISGWFIDQKGWRKSERDEKAVFEVLQRPPLLAMVWHSGGPAPQRPTSACGTLELRIADMPGRAVCYQRPETGQSEIAVVVADEAVGFVLLFQQRNLDWMALRDKVLRLLPRFEVERAAGDPALLKWMK